MLLLTSSYHHPLTAQANLQGKQNQAAFYENRHWRQMPITTLYLLLVQTPRALQALLPHSEGFWTTQNEDQCSQLSTEDAGSAFNWHNSLTTLCLSTYKTYLCLWVLPQTWKRNLSSRRVHDLCRWWYNAHQSLRDEGNHPLWPGDCTDYKLKTQLQFYHCCYCLVAKAEKKEKVLLGGV